MMFEQIKHMLTNAVMNAMPIEAPKPALPENKWMFLGETKEKRRFHVHQNGRNFVLGERPVKVFTYRERSKYDGAALREIRARNGVGRPPKHRRVH